MPLAKATPLLAAAERGGYAVPGFNVSNVEMALGVVAAAEALRAPLFLQFNPANFQHIGGIEVAAAVGRVIAGRSAVPVALHLDHAPTVALIRQAIGLGFTSLMFDGSTFPLERNLRETMQAYAAAQEGTLALEAELGHVGGREAGVRTSEAVLTDPEVAARFVRDTRVDSLAVSVGTAHGLAGEIQLDLVRELRIATRQLPLVLHGGSGATPHDLREGVRAGIRKVNIGTEIHTAFARALRESTGNDPRAGLRAGRDAVAAVAADRIRLLGAAQRA